MLDVLTNIAEFLSQIGNFFLSIITGFIQLFQYIAMALESVAVGIVYLPTSLTIIAMAFVSVAVVYLIVGR